MTTMKLSEGLERGEGLEMRKVNSKLPPAGVAIGRKGGEQELPTLASLSSSTSGEKGLVF